MKKIYLIAFAASIVTICACGGASQDNDKTPNPVDEQIEAGNKGPLVPITPEEISTGDKLVQSLDCLTCHKTNAKMVGPAYVDVAKKYKATQLNIDMLSAKIINGGSGHWGNVDMTPHPGINQVQAAQIVKYILSVKG